MRKLNVRTYVKTYEKTTDKKKNFELWQFFIGKLNFTYVAGKKK